MKKLRTVLRLYTEGKSKSFISGYCRISRNTVKKYIARFKSSKLTYNLVEGMSKSALHTLFQSSEQVELDPRFEVLESRFIKMQKALSKHGVTLQRLWE